MKSNRLFLFISASIFLSIIGCAANQKKIGETTTPAQMKVSSDTPERTTQLRATMLEGLAVRSLQTPTSWIQKQRRWAPGRYFGPLYGNSPDIHLNGGSAKFVYNDFFAGSPDASVFQKYYGPTLPSNQPTPAEAIPGTLPSADGFRDLRLGFDQLRYSSRYGGSFKLIFRSLENFQVEYRKASTVWDIGSLEMTVYVCPVPAFFNPNAPLGYVPNDSVHVEFRPQGVIGYTITNGILAVQEGDPLPALMTALAASAQTMAQGHEFARDATRFSHGLVHVAFWDEIGQTNTVTAIEISDDYFLPRTRAGRAVAVVTAQVADVMLDTEPGSEEIYITLLTSHIFKDVDIPPTFRWESPRIDMRESTDWHTVGVFPLDWDCLQLQYVLLMITVREEDDITFDDKFDTKPSYYTVGPLDCSGMQAAFDNGKFGLYKDYGNWGMQIVQDSENAGALILRRRVFLIRL